jgi:hypothetical protein
LGWGFFFLPFVLVQEWVWCFVDLSWEQTDIETLSVSGSVPDHLFSYAILMLFSQ